MERPNPDARAKAAVAWCGRTGVLVVFAFAASTWVGWATGIDRLTRIYPAWPQMMPWTALWLAALGAAILVQSGQPSRGRVWAGRGRVGRWSCQALASSGSRSRWEMTVETPSPRMVTP